MEPISVAVLSALFTGGVTWGAVKSTLNGTVAKVDRIDAKLHEVAEDVAFLKGKIEDKK